VAFIFIFAGLSATLCWGRKTAQLTRKPSDEPSYRLYNSTAQLPDTPFAIATFLTGQSDSDTYFTATRVLAHQLIHAPATKCDITRVSFLVLCSQSTPEEHKVQLRKDGAYVVELQDVPVNWWIYSGIKRWKEQFTKLRIFEMIEYKRILFVDADTLIVSPIDSIFEEPEVETLAPSLTSRKDQIRRDEAALPAEWFFAARSDNGYAGQRQHPTPPLQTTQFSAGFFMVAPDRILYSHLLSVMSHFRRFDPFTMEQGLLNYVFRRDGVMPWRELHWKWSATWVNEKDAEMGVKSMHEKLWDKGPQVLKDLWQKRKGEMLHYYEHR
jgi:alpha-N-acetylglucosamine transferase